MKLEININRLTMFKLKLKHNQINKIQSINKFQDTVIITHKFINNINNNRLLQILFYHYSKFLCNKEELLNKIINYNINRNKHNIHGPKARIRSSKLHKSYSLKLMI